MLKNTELKGTKAETLLSLSQQGFPVPKVYYFDVHSWNQKRTSVLSDIETLFNNTNELAIRSSAKAEDTAETSMAGAFHSVLNVDSNNSNKIEEAIKEVIASFDDAADNQVLIQPMINNVLMSGVVMTKVLDDGSPYYVINFDDKTGKTDTVTSGNSINKTVYVYNGVNDSDFDSKLLLQVLKLVRKLENFFLDTPLDIEYAIDANQTIYLLQVRRITTSKYWNANINKLVSNRIGYLREYIKCLMTPRTSLYGKKTLLGIMPDWNPAEMIGVVPHPLAMSLYRELITKRAWSIAREKMGYRIMPHVELMVSLFGRTYIDVRNSMNSFMPSGLSDEISEKLLNAYLNRLEKNPHLHDKIEFEVVFTAFDFEFDDKYFKRYEGLLTEEEYLVFRSSIKSLTKNAILETHQNTLQKALGDIERLKKIQSCEIFNSLNDPFAIADRINTMLSECIKYGTIPFSIVARHGFIAELLLRSSVNVGAISDDRLSDFRKSVRTIAGKMSEDFYKVSKNIITKTEFLNQYGHLRPSSYDVLSPRYCDRKDIFEGNPQMPNDIIPFELTTEERSRVNILLLSNGFDGINADNLFQYAATAIKGREYAKFVFTKHLSDILEYIARWGVLQGFERQDVSMLTINDVLDALFSPLADDAKEFYKRKIERSQERYDVASSFKLNYLIRSPRDVNVVPMQRSSANFVGNKHIEENIVFLNPYNKSNPELYGKIVCIEGADPGYDWIFARNIAGLVTKYGGANSHMAIRCAELDIPAAIGCGEQPFDRIVKAGKCFLDCKGKRLEPISLIS